MPLDGLTLDAVVDALVSLVQGIGALVILLSVGRAIAAYVPSYLRSRGQVSAVDRIRLDLGSGLVLGLEFLIAADIVRTILTPTWEDILVLAAIIAIRTVLSASIVLELERLQSRGRHSQQST